MGHNATFFEMTPEDMEGITRPALAMEYITTRDVEEGEELFLDYGTHWIEAFEAHSEQWEVPEDWTHPDELNEEETKIKTQHEKEESGSYPHNVQIRCHHDLSDPNWMLRAIRGHISWERLRLDHKNPHHQIRNHRFSARVEACALITI